MAATDPTGDIVGRYPSRMPQERPIGDILNARGPMALPAGPLPAMGRDQALMALMEMARQRQAQMSRGPAPRTPLASKVRLGAPFQEDLPPELLEAVDALEVPASFDPLVPIEDQPGQNQVDFLRELRGRPYGLGSFGNELKRKGLIFPGELPQFI